MHWPAPHGAWPVAQGVVAAVGPETVEEILGADFFQDEAPVNCWKKSLDPRNLQQDPRVTDPEQTWVSNSSIATYKTGSVGIRSYSIFGWIRSKCSKIAISIIYHLIANFWCHLMYRWYVAIKLRTARNGVTTMWCYVGWESFLYKKYISPSWYHYEHMYM